MGGLRSVRLRLALLLTLAVLPIGVIVFLQSRDAADHARDMSQSALLGEAIRAAAAQRAVIRTAQGQARALLPLLQALPPNPKACSKLMREVVKATETIAFSGFAAPDGRMVCSSARGHDAAERPPFPLPGPEGADEGRIVSGAVLGPLPGALAVVQPVVGRMTSEAGVASEQSHAGTVLLTLPHSALFTSDAIPGPRPAALDLATLNRAGEILWASPFAPGTIVGDPEAADLARLPPDIDVAALVALPAHTLVARNGAGERRHYAAVPVIEGEIVTLASWQPGSLFDDAAQGANRLPILLPLAMWLLSLTVAYLTVNRLLLQPLSSLGERMQAFTAGERMLPPFLHGRAPEELAELSDNFDAMTARIVRDETRLEKAVHDQEVLLKEVHHRVKNNLQLIASILNMQIRQDQPPENRAVLRRVQDRVMSLATVYHHLYRTSALSALRADALVSEIVNRKLADAAQVARNMSVETQYERIQLYPDQAVPLSLLVGEAVSNVFHHVGRPSSGDIAWMRLSLTQDTAGSVTLSVSNSTGPKIAEAQDVVRAGLGTRLIEAFAEQLDGAITRDRSDTEAWTLRLTFRTQGFAEADRSPESNTDADTSTSATSATESDLRQ
ncbi:MAG: sensor histidine kinase [Pseudomonadota bacterium]